MIDAQRDPVRVPPEPADGDDEPRHRLHRLLRPSSVCVVGASERQGSPGRAVLANLLAAGWSGPLLAVSPRHRSVMGIACERRVRDLDTAPDLAVVAVPPAALVATLTDLAALGTRHALLLPAAGATSQAAHGTGAATPSAATAASALAALGRSLGLRIVGPESLGLAHPAIGLNATVSRSRIAAGSLAIVAESSSVCAALLDFAEGSGIGVSTVLATGAGVDVDVADLLDYLSYDAETRSIAVHLEGVRDARRLLGALRAAARSKPVVVLRAGQACRSDDDPVAPIPVTHTEVLACSDEAFASALRRSGAVAVDSFGELFGAVEWLGAGRRVRGDRLGIVSNGAGLAVLGQDACRRYRVRCAALAPVTIAAVQADDPTAALAAAPLAAAAVAPAAAAAAPTDAVSTRVPGIAVTDPGSAGSPVSLGASATPARLAAAIDVVAADRNVDAVLGLFHPSQAADSAAIAEALLGREPAVPAMFAFLGDADARHGRDRMNAQGHSVFGTPEAAVRAFSILAEYQRSQRQLIQSPAPIREAPRFDAAAVDAIIATALAAGQQTLDEIRSKQLLAACGIDVPRTLMARTIEEATKLADRIGYPVVLKLVSPDISHKSDVGGVRLDIRDKLELRGAATGIQQRLRTAAPQARFDGFTVQPMIRRGDSIELLVGVSRDPAFGPLIRFGAGGVATEVIADTASALPPLNATLALELIGRTRIARLLNGMRLRPPVAIDAIVDVLLAISALVCRFPAIRAIDINPLLASEGGALALDARIVLDPANPQRDRRYRHLAIHPYPAEVETWVALRPGRSDPNAATGPQAAGPQATAPDSTGSVRVHLRPIRPDDAEQELAFFDGLSAESRQWRFLHPIRSLTPEMVARFTQVDYDRDMALVALPTDAGPAPPIIGVARYAREADAGRCEFAIVVADAWQRRGVAHALMVHLIAQARAAGLDTMIGHIHGQNLRMLNFVRRLGFTLDASPEDPSLRQATLLLKPAADAAP